MKHIVQYAIYGLLMENNFWKREGKTRKCSFTLDFFFLATNNKSGAKFLMCHG